MNIFKRKNKKVISLTIYNEWFNLNRDFKYSNFEDITQTINKSLTDNKDGFLRLKDGDELILIPHKVLKSCVIKIK